MHWISWKDFYVIMAPIIWFGKECNYHDNIGEEIVERAVRVQIRHWRCTTITCGGDGGMEHRWSIIIVK